jgi:hypothetical protein
MPANFERTKTISRIAGADFTGYPSAGEYKFGITNPNAIAAGSYTPADVPGLWYGSSQAAPAIPAGNVIVNPTAGADCDYVIVGKALPGQPVECSVDGRTLITVGTGGLTAGQDVMSDANGNAVAWTSGNWILGTCLTTASAGSITDILFNRRGYH